MSRPCIKGSVMYSRGNTSAATLVVVLALLNSIQAKAATQTPDSDPEPKLLPPVAKIPMPAGVEQARISPDGTEVVLVLSRPSIEMRGAFAEHASEVITVCLVMWLGLEALWAWKRRHHAKIVGQPFCNRCGYQLTGVDVAVCPECGVNLTPRNRVIGGRDRAWIQPARVIVTCALTVFIALSPRLTKRVVNATLPEWHHHWLHESAERNRIQWLLEHESQLYEAHFYSLDPWEFRRKVPLGVKEAKFVIGSQLHAIYGQIVEDKREIVVRWDVSDGSRKELFSAAHEEMVLLPQTTTAEEFLVIVDYLPKRPIVKLIDSDTGENVREIDLEERYEEREGYFVGYDWLIRKLELGPSQIIRLSQDSSPITMASAPNGTNSGQHHVMALLKNGEMAISQETSSQFGPPSIRMRQTATWAAIGQPIVDDSDRYPWSQFIPLGGERYWLAAKGVALRLIDVKRMMATATLEVSNYEVNPMVSGDGRRCIMLVVVVRPSNDRSLELWWYDFTSYLKAESDH